MTIAIRLFVLLCVTMLAGCKMEVPAFDTASVAEHTAGRITNSGTLSEAQVRGLRDWLAQQKTGWKHRLESTAPALFVTLEQQGKPVGTLNVMPTQVKVGDYFKPITPEEHQMLRFLLTTFLNSNKKAN